MASEYADRLDLIAYRLYGAITDAAVSALARANPALPLAVREGVAVQVPEAVARLRYGATFPGWDRGRVDAILAEAPPAPADFDPRDFDARDFLTAT